MEPINFNNIDKIYYFSKNAQKNREIINEGWHNILAFFDDLHEFKEDLCNYLDKVYTNLGIPIENIENYEDPKYACKMLENNLERMIFLHLELLKLKNTKIAESKNHESAYKEKLEILDLDLKIVGDKLRLLRKRLYEFKGEVITRGMLEKHYDVVIIKKINSQINLLKHWIDVCEETDNSKKYIKALNGLLLNASNLKIKINKHVGCETLGKNLRIFNKLCVEIFYMIRSSSVSIYFLKN
jgi:hypothetical protein